MRRSTLLVLLAACALGAPAAVEAGVHMGGKPPIKPHRHHHRRDEAAQAAEAAQPPAPATPPAPAGW